MELEFDLRRIGDSEWLSGRDPESRTEGFVYAHEMCHVVQSAGTIYGASCVVGELASKAETYHAVFLADHENGHLEFPLNDWAKRPNCPPRLSKSLRARRDHRARQIVSEGGLLSRNGHSLAIVEEAEGEYWSNSGVHLVAYRTPEEGIGPARFKVIWQNPLNGSEHILGGRAVKEAWAILDHELQDLLLGHLYGGEYDDFSDPFERLRHRSKHDERFGVYWAAVDYTLQYLNYPEHWFSCTNGLMRLFDFVLMNTNLLAPKEFPELWCPDLALLQALRVIKEVGGWCPDNPAAIWESNTHMDDLFGEVRRELGLPSESEQIEAFIDKGVKPTREYLGAFPVLSADVQYLDLIEEALRARLDQPGVYYNRMNFECRRVYARVVSYALERTLAVVRPSSGEGFGGENFTRWLTAELLEDMTSSEPVGCPMAKSKVRCAYLLGDACNRPLSELVRTLHRERHLCHLSTVFGRFQILNFALSEQS